MCVCVYVYVYVCVRACGGGGGGRGKCLACIHKCFLYLPSHASLCTVCLNVCLIWGGKLCMYAFLCEEMCVFVQVCL